MSLHNEIQRIAAQHPETREHLIPLLRKHADESVLACTCPDGGKSAGMGDELMGGRTWGNPDPRSKPDDNTPYNRHEDSPPAGADGSPQRKKYNEWFRTNVCPKHKTNCGAPWLKAASEMGQIRVAVEKMTYTVSVNVPKDSAKEIQKDLDRALVDAIHKIDGMDSIKNVTSHLRD